MDLGIRGRKAIVCASSKGLGRGCAMALAEAGCDVVVNGRKIARGEITVLESDSSRFGIRLTEIIATTKNA